MVRTNTMLAKIEFHDIDSWNMVRGTSEVYATIIHAICGIKSGLCVCIILWWKDVCTVCNVSQL
jgi:hypothetical protein